MMCYYLNVQFQGQRVNIIRAFSWNKKKYFEISVHSGKGTYVYPVHHLMCSFGKLPLGRYLRNAGSEGTWLSECYLCKSIYHLHYNVCAGCNVLEPDVSGTGMFHWHLVPYNTYQHCTLRLPFASSLPHFLNRQVEIYQNWTVHFRNLVSNSQQMFRTHAKITE